MQKSHLLTIKEASSFLKLSRSTVYRYCKCGLIPHIKMSFGVRLREKDLERWLDTSKVKPSIHNKNSWNPLTYSLPPAVNRAIGGELAMAKSKTRLSFVINGEIRKGTIYKRKTRNGWIWCVNFVDTKGARIRKVAGNAQTKEEALIVLREEIRKSARCYSNGKRCGTFEEYSELYLEHYARPSKKSWKCDFYALEAHLKPYFGKLMLEDITPLLIEQFRSEKLKSGLAGSSTNRLIALLKTMFSVANRWNLVQGNPAKEIRLFSERDNLVERILSPSEEERLLMECALHLKPIVIAALNTGMRRNEILSLRWECVDLKQRFIKVVKTKSGKNRIIPINDVLCDVLRDQERRNSCEYVFPNPETKRPLKSIRHSFENACRRANIKGLRFHDLRHTFSCRLVQKGCDIETLRALLGHHSITVTERYIHTDETQKRHAVELLKGCKERGPKRLFETSPKRHEENVTCLFSVN